MLSVTQLQKLEPYTKHPKYGKILQEAIEGWKTSNPDTHTYGIFFNPIELCYVADSRTNETCLIGASLCNKYFGDMPKSLEDATVIYYNINAHEHGSIVSGFDRSRDIHPAIKNWDYESYMFGFEIGKIIFNLDAQRTI